MRQVSIRVSDAEHARLTTVATQQTRSIANLTLHYVRKGLNVDAFSDCERCDLAPNGDCQSTECTGL